MDGKKLVIELRQLDELEEKVARVTEMIGALRRERDAARGEAAEGRKALAALQAETRTLERDRQGAREAQAELDILREERQAVRGRVTRMLEMMAALDESEVEVRSDH